MKKNQKIETVFSKQFNINYPIVCAPMFLVSTEKLVSCVSNAGGVGTFPALNYRPIENYRKAIINIKNQTDKAFGTNIIVQKSNKYQTGQIDTALEENVPLIITSLGNPKDVIRLAHQTKTKVYCDVVGSEHAKKVMDFGADGLVAVGSGAGGHAGDISLFVLVPYLVRQTKLPVLAAGGISDGAGMAAALVLGASGVYVGTRFIASKEAEVDVSFKQAILDSKSEDIINTDKVDGFPGNFINTDALKKVGLKKGIIEEVLSKSKKIKKGIALSRAARSLLAKDNSKVSYKSIFSAGQGVGIINEILTVEEIVQSMVKEYHEIKSQLP
jgi:nitronate monooxygenase